MLISLESIIIAKFIIFIKHYQVTTAELDHDVAMLRSEPLQTQVCKFTQTKSKLKRLKTKESESSFVRFILVSETAMFWGGQWLWKLFLR
jgi:hypothetical protein